MDYNILMKHNEWKAKMKKEKVLTQNQVVWDDLYTWVKYDLSQSIFSGDFF